MSVQVYKIAGERNLTSFMKGTVTVVNLGTYILQRDVSVHSTEVEVICLKTNAYSCTYLFTAIMPGGM